MISETDLDRCSRGDLKALIHSLLRQVDLLERQVKEQAQRIAEQDRHIAELEARLNEPPKNSGNSSLPPSRGFKANKNGADDKQGKDGAAKREGLRQKSVGRKGHHRPLCATPDEIVRVTAKTCACCQRALNEGDQTLCEAYDKIDIPPVKPHVTRVEIYEGVCPHCAARTKASSVPCGLERGSPFSAGIAALAIYLRFVQAISYERLARCFRDLFGLGVSEGALNAMLHRSKPRFDEETEGILKRLRKSRVVYSDETSVRIEGKNWWNWVFQNDEITLHVIRRSRGHGVVEDVMDGHKPALWVSDLYGAQQGHAQEWQVCLAHQLRDCRYAIEAGDAIFAPRMKSLILRAFVIAKRRKTLAAVTRKHYRARLEREMDAIMALAVEQKDGRRLRKRYGKHRGSLFTFLDHLEIAPDNNSSERALRPTATYRKVTGGFRSTWGADLYAAVRSTLGTAAKAGQNPFATIQTILGISMA